MIVEGYREVRRALDNRHVPATLFLCREMFQGSNEDSLIRACGDAGTRLIECTASVFAKLSYRDRPDGLLAVAPQLRGTLADLSPSSPSLIVVAESIEKPGNLGTILRSADAVAADAVLVCDRCTDVSNPNVVRASVGALFCLPVIETASTDAQAWLHARGFRIAAATPHADAIYTDADLTGDVAVAVGSEQYGLSSHWLDRADIRVRIPMRGQCDSLNVASATTLLLYECLRQRAG